MKITKLTIVIALTFVMGLLTTGDSAEAHSISADNVTMSATDSDEKNLEHLERAVLYGLGSEYDSIVEKTLLNAVEFKTVYPELSSERIEDKLVETVNEGTTHVIRYKAYLTLMYFRNYEEFNSRKLAMLFDYDLSNPNTPFLVIDEAVRVNQITAR